MPSRIYKRIANCGSAGIAVYMEDMTRDALYEMARADDLSGRTKMSKRELVEALTRETARVLGVREQSVWVVLQEVEPENWAVAGTPLSER